MPTYNLTTTHSGGETVNNVLAGLPVAQVGLSGSVTCAFDCSVVGAVANVRAIGLNGTEVSIIPDGSSAIVTNRLEASNDFIYRTGGLSPGSAILASITVPGACNSILAVRTY